MERHIGNMFISLISCHLKIIKNKSDILWKEFLPSLFCIKSLELLILDTPLHPTSFAAIKRQIGKMFISFILCHEKIIKDKNNILWKEFWLSCFCFGPLELLNLALIIHLLPVLLRWKGIFDICFYCL